MIYIGLGSNLPSSAGSPLSTVKTALKRLLHFGIEVRSVSHWYESEPVPVSDQPWFVNGVAEVETSLKPVAVLKVLLEVEQEFGRERGELNAARSLDLDLLDYDGMVLKEGLILPHPRLHQRAFVLHPLKDVAPQWVHPVLGLDIPALSAQFCANAKISKLAEDQAETAQTP